jgi:hypothetical protein
MTRRRNPNDAPSAILPVLFNPPFSQNNAQAGKVGTPHRPLLPERLPEEYMLVEDQKLIPQVYVNPVLTSTVHYLSAHSLHS